MKEIKTKPEGGKPRLLDSAAKAPKTAMKDAWLKSKEKAVSELKGTPFASQQGETSNAPANSAGDLLKYEPKIPLPRRSKENLKKQ